MERLKPGRSRIREALIEWSNGNRVDSLSVVALCEMARVGRSTFYTYYSNVDDVFRELVRDLIQETSPIRPQLRCSDCHGDSIRRPLCELIRAGGKYHGLAKQDAFLPMYCELIAGEFEEQALGPYWDVCPDREIAEALYRFQTIGCVETAKRVPAEADWERIRRTLDAFIRGGINSVRNLHS